MKFKKYTSIENSHRKKFVADCVSAIELGYCKDDFVVEEKAHGANFAFYYNGTELKTASRSGFLENDGDGFYKSHHLKRRYEKAIEELYLLLGSRSNERTKENTAMTIRVVGELIGGSYRHPDVERDPRVPRVQDGVDYCPGHEFYAFDLHVLSEREGANGEVHSSYTTPVDKLEMNRLFGLAGFLYARPLFRGTLTECLAFGNTFRSHIPGWLGLPEHPETNHAEGKVIKPVAVATLANKRRIILKDKTERFSEVRRNGPTNEATATVTASQSRSDSGNALEAIARAHITANRLASVRSKEESSSSSSSHLESSATARDCGRIAGLLVLDALEEFRSEHGEAFDALDRKEQKLIRKQLVSDAMAVVREQLSKKR